MSTENENESLGRQHFGDEDETGEDTQGQETEQQSPDEDGAGDESQEQQETTGDESSDAEQNEDGEEETGDETDVESDEDDGASDDEESGETEAPVSGQPQPVREQMVRDQSFVERDDDEHSSLYMLRVNLSEYEKRMARGKPQDVNSVISAQRQLHSILVSAFTQPSERLRDAGNIVYKTFRDNTTGAFSAVYVNRGLREMAQQDRNKAFTLRGVCNIILRTLDPRDRDEVLQHVDLKPMLDEIDDADVRAGLMEYLRIG